MPAEDATLNYTERNVLLPSMRVGETLRINWIPLYHPTNASVTYSQTRFARSGSGNSRTYTASSSGNGTIVANSSTKNYSLSTIIRGGGGSAKANRLPLSDLENTIRISPGMTYTSVDLHNFEWVLADDDEHDDLSFTATTLTGADITYSISGDKLIVTAGANEARLTIRISAQNADDDDVGDTADVELLVRDIEGREPPTSTQNGSTLPPLATNFQDPVASLSGLRPSSISDGLSFPGYTVVNRMSGNLAKVTIDEGLHITCEVTRKDEASFSPRVLDAKDGRFYSHMGRTDSRGFIVRWGYRTRSQ